MAIIKTNDNTPIYQFFNNSEHQREIKYNNQYNYSPTNQDNIVTKDFLDSSGSYTQLRAVQIAPYDEYGVYDEERDNKLLLFAQAKEKIQTEEEVPHISVRFLNPTTEYEDTYLINIDGQERTIKDDELPETYTLNNINYPICQHIQKTENKILSIAPIRYIIIKDNNTEYILEQWEEGASTITKPDTNYFSLYQAMVNEDEYSDTGIAEITPGGIEIYYNNQYYVLQHPFEDSKIYLIEDNNLKEANNLKYQIIYGKEEEIELQIIHYYYKFDTMQIEYNTELTWFFPTKDIDYYKNEFNQQNLTLSNGQLNWLPLSIMYNNANILKAKDSLVIGSWSESLRSAKQSLFSGFQKLENTYMLDLAFYCCDTVTTNGVKNNVMYSYIIPHDSTIGGLGQGAVASTKIITNITYLPEEDNLGYIGSIIVDKDFKLNSVQYIVDSLGAAGLKSLQDYLGDDFNDIYYFEYDSFDGSGARRNVIFGNEGLYNTIQPDTQIYSIKQPVTNIKEYIISADSNDRTVVLDSETYYCYKVEEDNKTTYHMYDITNIQDDRVLVNGSSVVLPSRTYIVTIENDICFFKPTNYNLCMVDVVTDKPNSSNNNERDIWSLLYMPYTTNDQLEVFICGLLKSTTSRIDKQFQPTFTISYNNISNNFNNALSLYNIEEQSDYFFAAKSGNSLAPQIENFGSLDEGNIYLNNAGGLFGTESNPDENAEESGLNPYTWPLENKKYNTILKPEMCYFSLDRENWYHLPYTVKDYTEFQDNNLNSEHQNPRTIIKNIIDFGELNEREDFAELPNSNYTELFIQDKDNNTFNNNGNILLRAGNTISIPIINNCYDIATVKDKDGNNLDFSFIPATENTLAKIEITDAKGQIYSTPAVYSESKILTCYTEDLSNSIEIIIETSSDNGIYLRIYKEDK